MLKDDGLNIIGSASYDDRVAHALADFLRQGRFTEIDALARILGHHFGSVGPETFGDELTVITTWTTVLRSYNPTFGAASYAEECMLTGLLRGDRWRTLFGSESGAYEFFIVLARYLRKDDARARNAGMYISGNRAFRLDVHSAIPAWLEPGIEPGEFTLRDLARAFFGEAWCAIVYDVCGDETTLSDIVASTRPPFLPGRLTYDTDPNERPLPELAC
jgi:hypothetical protein